MTDVTQRKKVEETLIAIENARKKETHHRIKNNLQVISSLLDLQAEKFRDKDSIQYSEVLEAFRESQDRVTSIALIHEELQEVLMKRELFLRCLEGEQYPISSAIKKKIMEQPCLIDWIMTSIPVGGRCLMLYPTWSVEHSDWEVLKGVYI